MRKDGFASLDAGIETGEIVTRPLIGASGPLLLNADASGGWIQVEVLDSEGNVIPGLQRGRFRPPRRRRRRSAGDLGVPIRSCRSPRTPCRYGSSSRTLRSIPSTQGTTSTSIAPEPIRPIRRACCLRLRETGGRRFPTHCWETVRKTRRWFPEPRRSWRTPPRAAHGENFMEFPTAPSTANLFEIPDTQDLGRGFTLSATVDETSGDFSRLFSAYNGGTLG